MSAFQIFLNIGGVVIEDLQGCMQLGMNKDELWFIRLNKAN
jgi:hypothetical protein